MSPTWPERVVEAGVLFLLVFTPLAFGTVEVWSEAVAELVVLAVVVAWVAGNLRNWELRVELPPGWLPAALFLGLVALQAAAPGGSLDAHATRRLGLKLAAVAALLLVCYNTYRSRAQVHRAVWTMIGTGTALAVLGIVQRMTWNGRLYWVGPPAHGAAFGPFVNRTHFAGLMVAVVPAALALMLTSRRGRAGSGRGRARSWRERAQRTLADEGGRRFLLRFLVLLMGGAALVSGSRGGLVAVLASVLAMAVVAAGGGSRWRRLLGLAGVAALIVLAAVWIGADVFYGTVEHLGAEVGDPERSPRVRLWADAMRLWRTAPLLGTGLGTFGVALPAFRTIGAPVVYAHAESDWVELLADTGLVGLGLALAAAVACAIPLAAGRHGAGAGGRPLVAAGLVALLGAGLQGVANYNLPVMSNQIYVAVLLALAARFAGAGPERRPSRMPGTALAAREPAPRGA